MSEFFALLYETFFNVMWCLSKVSDISKSGALMNNSFHIVPNYCRTPYTVPYWWRCIVYYRISSTYGEFEPIWMIKWYSFVSVSLIIPSLTRRLNFSILFLIGGVSQSFEVNLFDITECESLVMPYHHEVGIKYIFIRLLSRRASTHNIKKYSHH